MIQVLFGENEKEVTKPGADTVGLRANSIRDGIERCPKC